MSWCKQVWCWSVILFAQLVCATAMAHSPPTRLPDVDPSIPSAPPEGPWVRSFFDWDAYTEAHPGVGGGPHDDWSWHVMPEGLIFPSYLAGNKESRMATSLVHLRDIGWQWEATLGARVGLLRFGNRDLHVPLGFQIDAEGSAQVRLDLPDEVDVRAVDFRGGVPLTFGYGRHRTKFGYYHMSSHLGDEFLLANPGFPRLNWTRDALVLGHAYYLNENVKIYAEAAWAFVSEVNEPWEFQFGLDYAPLYGTGCWGAPFFAVNAHLRQEVEFGGGLTAQAGWAWRSAQSTKMMRLGVHYYNGKSNQNSFYNDFEQQLGLGAWYDF